jgi:hypothetical protein
MWLIISAVAAMCVTAVYLFVSEKYKLELLAIGLWGLTACIFVDHTMGFLMEGGGEYFEISAEALVLSISMLIPIFAVWELYVLVTKLREKHLVEVSAEKITESV